MALEMQVRLPYDPSLYIQRDEEDKIRRELQKAKAGDIFLIQGPPGIGKTWLIQHVLKDLQGRFVYLDVLDGEWNTHYEGIRLGLQEKDIFIRTLTYWMLQKVLQKAQNLFRGHGKARKREDAEDIYTLRERLEFFLANLSSPLYLVVDHVNEIPEEVRDEIKRFLLMPILDTNHILVLVGRSEPYLGYPIAIPEERIIDVTSLFGDKRLQALLAKYGVAPGGIEDTLKGWTDGHPLAASVLARAWKSHRSDRWEDYREVFQTILQELLRVLPGDFKAYIDLLHLLSWGKPEEEGYRGWGPPWHPQWIKKSVALENRKEALRLVRDLTQHAFCHRKEQPFYRLFTPNLFFMATLAQLQCNQAGQIYGRIQHMLQEWKKKQFQTLSELEQAIMRRKREFDTLCSETPQATSSHLVAEG